MSMHPAAQQGFGSAAGEYERARPDYPQPAVDHLADVLNIATESRVLDLACGTGKMTRLLASTGAWIAGLDPVGSMLMQFRQSLPGVPVVAGMAEHLPFDAASLDAVVAAQAFHWFDGPAALAELHRVLKPDSSLGLIWNVRDESVAWVKAMGDIFRSQENKNAADVLRFWKGSWRKAFKRQRLFAQLQRKNFRHEQVLSRDGVIERVMSVSFIAALPKPERDDIAARMRSIIDTDPDTRDLDEIRLPYSVEVYWTRRK